MTNFSAEQDDALLAVSRWLAAKPGRGASQVFRLFGYAGTGKTTLAQHVAADLDGDTRFCAFTGKAALVMRERGCPNASTIHSLIYKPQDRSEEHPSFFLWDEAPAAKASLIVVDECSMVDEELGRDLLSFGIPVLVLGDPAQLPPVSGGGFFTEGEPDAMLTQVHRQAADNPIIHLSMQIREGGRLAPGSYGESQVVAMNDLDPELVYLADQVLVGRNVTRRNYNARLREIKGFDGDLPEADDKLVCLRNNRKKSLFNGSLWTVKERSISRKKFITMRLNPEDSGLFDTVKVSVRPECFLGGIEQMDWVSRKKYDEFDYGYVLTVHKAQGSQWDEVVLFDESFAFQDARARWLYTGVTRAARKLTVVV